MKSKFLTLSLAIVVTSFTNLWAQQQTVPISEKQKTALGSNLHELAVDLNPTSDVKFTKMKAFANHFTGGLSNSTQEVCESAYTFFYSGAFGSGPIYWDPSLSMLVTWGTVIVNHSTSIIYNFNASTSTIGSPIGNCQ